MKLNRDIHQEDEKSNSNSRNVMKLNRDIHQEDEKSNN